MNMPSGWFHSWSGCTDQGIATISCITVVFWNIVNALTIFAGLTALMMFLFGAYKLVNSAGDQKKLDSAKHSFTYGILGLSVVLLSFVILKIISEITGVSCIFGFGLSCQ